MLLRTYSNRFLMLRNHMGMVVLRAFHINRLHLFWDKFEWFCHQISSDAKYFFLSCRKHWDWRLIVIIVYYFQIWNKKEHNIIISSRVISSYMGPMLIEILYLYTYWVGRNNRAVTWVPCRLRHSIYPHIEWAEIIGQSHGSHVDWDTLFIHILSGQK